MKLIEECRTLVNKEHFPVWGIIGSIIGLVFILTPQLFYVGTHGEPFSMFNHYVSELGEIGVSQLAMVFNVGLMLAGIFFVPFMVGFGLYLNNIIGKLAGLVGVFSAIAIIMVGIFPMNYMTEHGLAAISFFLSGLIMSLLWAVGILAQKDARVPKVFSLGGFITTTIFALFLYGPWEGISDLSTRPAFNMVVTLEWAIYFSIVGYLLILALYVWRKEMNAMSQ